MAMDSQGRIFASYGEWSNAYEIYEINPSNGQATFVSQTNLFGLSALAFDDNDLLFALNDRTAPHSGSPMDLYSVDLFSGATTLVGDTGIRNSLAMDFYNGSLYCFNPYNGLHKVDSTTGIATDVNTLFRGPIGSTASMCFSDSGTLYHLDGGLWMVDKETGTFSLNDTLSPFGFWAEAVFVEGPTNPLSLWLAGRTDGPIRVKVSGATPGGRIAFAWSQGLGGPTPVPSGFSCAGVEMDLAANMQMVAVATADSNGEATLGPQWVPTSAIQNYRIQAIDLATCETSNKVVVYF